MRLLARLSLALIGFVAIPLSASCQDVRGLAREIDRHIGDELARRDVIPAPLADDPSWFRRVTLDLAGRIPTTAEVDDFLLSRERDKRLKWVDQLVRSPDFAFHQRNEIDTLLLRRLEHNDKWREYLLEATEENRPWDQLFREIMLPDQESPDDLRPVAFLRKRLDSLDSTTNDTSILWFGVNVGCAKCHDHPLVYDWTQAHYYGLASFFKRTFKTKKGTLAERTDGLTKYTTTDGDELEAEFMFLTGTTVDEPDTQWDEAKLKEVREAIKKSEKDDKAETPPPPEFQPRAELVNLALSEKDQQYFAKNIVNRVWARLFGRGFVHPLDQMHSENPPSHPALLQRLSDDLVSHQYDLRRLVHAIVLTETYGRDAPRQGADDDATLFAATRPRPLSPHQLALACRVATARPGDLSGLTDPGSWAEKRADLERQSEGHARGFDIPDDGFQVSVSEALWFSNNAAVHNEFLQDSGNKLVGHLKEFDSDAEVSIRAYRAILARPPNGDEHKTVTDYLAGRHPRREEAIAQVVWALLSTPEFRFNH